MSHYSADVLSTPNITTILSENISEVKECHQRGKSQKLTESHVICYQIAIKKPTFHEYICVIAFLSLCSFMVKRLLNHYHDEKEIIGKYLNILNILIAKTKYFFMLQGNEI